MRLLDRSWVSQHAAFPGWREHQGVQTRHQQCLLQGETESAEAMQTWGQAVPLGVSISKPVNSTPCSCTRGLCDARLLDPRTPAPFWLRTPLDHQTPPSFWVLTSLDPRPHLHSGPSFPWTPDPPLILGPHSPGSQAPAPFWAFIPLDPWTPAPLWALATLDPITILDPHFPGPPDSIHTLDPPCSRPHSHSGPAPHGPQPPGFLPSTIAITWSPAPCTMLLCLLGPEPP